METLKASTQTPSIEEVQRILAKMNLNLQSSDVPPDHSSPYTWSAEGNPHPREFIVGMEMKHFRHPDPSDEQLREFLVFRHSSQWRTLAKMLQKGGNTYTSIVFDGDNSPTRFREWEHRIKYFFTSWIVINEVTQAELAMMTFIKTARDWWAAQRNRRPNLRLTFRQLCEWIRSELVPASSHSSSIRAWATFTFRGNLEAFFRELDNLMFYHPIEPHAAHAIAATPFGAEFVTRIENLDQDAGKGGITYPKLKQSIRAQVADQEKRLPAQRTHDIYDSHNTPWSCRSS